MEHQFWHDKWLQPTPGFHLEEVNPYLLRHWEDLALPKSCRVLIPLCGKSIDLWWLAKQGHQVIGVELSELAVKQFFSERGVTPQVTFLNKKLNPEATTHNFIKYTYNNITLFCGDFFTLTTQIIADMGSDHDAQKMLGGIHALYDRAAIIAMPPTMRERYSDKVKELLGKTKRTQGNSNAVKGLIITLTYPQQEMAGPPFSVPAQEIKQRYPQKEGWEITMLEEDDILDAESHFRAKGITQMIQTTFKVTHTHVKPLI